MEGRTLCPKDIEPGPKSVFKYVLSPEVELGRGHLDPKFCSLTSAPEIKTVFCSTPSRPQFFTFANRWFLVAVSLTRISNFQHKRRLIRFVVSWTDIWCNAGSFSDLMVWTHWPSLKANKHCFLKKKPGLSCVGVLEISCLGQWSKPACISVKKPWSPGSAGDTCVSMVPNIPAKSRLFWSWAALTSTCSGLFCLKSQAPGNILSQSTKGNKTKMDNKNFQPPGLLFSGSFILD